jgi:hypothetical protein
MPFRIWIWSIIRNDEDLYEIDECSRIFLMFLAFTISRLFSTDWSFGSIRWTRPMGNVFAINYWCVNDEWKSIITNYSSTCCTFTDFSCQFWPFMDGWSGITQVNHKQMSIDIYVKFKMGNYHDLVKNLYSSSFSFLSNKNIYSRFLLNRFGHGSFMYCLENLYEVSLIDYRPGIVRFF